MTVHVVSNPLTATGHRRILRTAISMSITVGLVLALCVVTAPAGAQSSFGDDDPPAGEGGEGQGGDSDGGEGQEGGDSGGGEGQEGGDSGGGDQGGGDSGGEGEDGASGAGCAAATVVSSSPELAGAVACYVAQTPAGTHTVTLSGDLVVETGVGIVVGPPAEPTASLVIDGAGHHISAPGNSSSAAVLTLGSGATVLVRNLVVSNAPGAGVLVESGAVQLVATTIESVGGDGLVVEGGSVVVVGSSIDDNGDDGVYVDGPEAQVHIESSTVDGNGDNGILLDAGSLSVTDAAISRNGDDGVDVRNEADVTLLAVEIADNGDDGIDHGAGTIVVGATHVRGNDGNGIVVNDSSAAARITGSTSFSNGKSGVLVDGVDASLADTTVAGNTDDGIELIDGTLTAIDVIVRSNGDNGLLLDGGSASFVGGEVSANVDDAFDARNGLALNVTGSGVLDNGDDGFDITDATVEIVDSYLAGNGDDGVGVFGASRVTVASSSVASNGDDGVDLRGENVVALITNSSIRNSGNDGVRAAGDGVTVANSSVVDSSLAVAGFDVNGPATVISSIVADCSASVDGGNNAGGCFDTAPTDTTVATPDTCTTAVVVVAGGDPMTTQCMPLVAIELGAGAAGAGTCVQVPVALDPNGAVIADLAVDQRGAARPTTGCDAGSYEVSGGLLTVLQTVPADAPAAGDWVHTVTAAQGCLADGVTSVEVTIDGAGGSAAPVAVADGCEVTVTQVPKDGWVTSSLSQTVLVVDEATVEFVNDPERTITITKTIVADPTLGLPLADDFSFSGPSGVFVLDAPLADDGDPVADTVVIDGLAAGHHTIVEATHPNWLPVDVTCEGATEVSGTTSGFGVDVIVDNSNRHVSCVFVNASDVDGDGVADVEDDDNDNDGQTDADEDACGSDKLDAGSRAEDSDADGTPDCLEVAEVVLVCGGVDIVATDDGGYAAPDFDGRLIVGTEGRDWLFGGAGRDLILGLGGNDVVFAGRGDDIVCAGAGNDLVIDGKGDDHVDGGSGNDAIHASLGDDELVGGDGADFLSGGWGNDRIDGGRGDDRLFGGAGNDDLDGGDGRDLCDGGWGRDTERNCERGHVVRGWWC